MNFGRVETIDNVFKLATSWVEPTSRSRWARDVQYPHSGAISPDFCSPGEWFLRYEYSRVCGGVE